MKQPQPDEAAQCKADAISCDKQARAHASGTARPRKRPGRAALALCAPCKCASQCLSAQLLRGQAENTLRFSDPEPNTTLLPPPTPSIGVCLPQRRAGAPAALRRRRRQQAGCRLGQAVGRRRQIKARSGPQCGAAAPRLLAVTLSAHCAGLPAARGTDGPHWSRLPASCAAGAVAGAAAALGRTATAPQRSSRGGSCNAAGALAACAGLAPRAATVAASGADSRSLALLSALPAAAALPERLRRRRARAGGAGAAAGAPASCPACSCPCPGAGRAPGPAPRGAALVGPRPSSEAPGPELLACARPASHGSSAPPSSSAALAPGFAGRALRLRLPARPASVTCR